MQYVRVVLRSLACVVGAVIRHLTWVFWCFEELVRWYCFKTVGNMLFPMDDLIPIHILPLRRWFVFRIQSLSMLVSLRFVCEWSAGACWTFTCSSLLVLNCLSFKASLIIFDSCLYNILRYLQSLHALGPKPEKSSWECRIVEGIYAIEYRDTALH